MKEKEEMTATIEKMEAWQDAQPEESGMCGTDGGGRVWMKPRDHAHVWSRDGGLGGGEMCGKS